MIADREHALSLLRDMIRVRRFEEKCAELYSATKIRGFLHLYIGQEAVAVGAMRALRPEDAIIATYREHGHALARGVPMTQVLAEMYGKVEGCSRGRGGSMHLFCLGTNFLGGYAIVGSHLPIAVGLALADKLQGRRRVTACFFGEGAAAEGEFHEALNLAALWELPVLFICENNLYAMGTALARSESETDISRKASAYRLRSDVVDGMDVLAVERAAIDAAERIRAGQGPQFLEMRTYRFRAHSMFDPELYREKNEVEEWKKRDPIAGFTEALRRTDRISEADLDEIEGGVAAEIEEAIDFAEAGAWEPVEDLTRDTYGPRAEPPPPPAAAESGGETSYREVLRSALRQALAEDPRVFIMGEDIGRYGGTYAVTRGLLEEFGPERVRDTPLSESAFVGAGIGAAIGGTRPIVEVMTVNFSLLAMDQIVNAAATLRHMSGGQLGVPLVIRMASGAGRQLAAQHSHSFESWYASVPGLRVVAPATLEDARGMLATALADPDPVLMFEHATLYAETGELAAGAGPVDLDRAAIRRPGSDVTLITYGGSLKKALAAAETLAAEGIDAEVLDLRTLRPLDEETILESVARTHRAVLIDECWESGSLASEIAARLVERGFYDLDAPVARVCTVEVPIPYPRHLEQAALPQPEAIAEAARNLVRSHG